MRGVDGRGGTGRTRAGARRGIGGGAPPAPGTGEEDRPGSDVADVGGRLVRRSALVIMLGVEGRESGSGVVEGVPGRIISIDGCRGALGGKTGGLGSGLSGSEDLTGGVFGSVEGSTGCG